MTRARPVLPLFGMALALLAPASALGDGGRDAQCADQAERGQELRDKGQLVAARELFISCAQQDCPTPVRASCNEWLGDLDRRLPSLVVSAKDAAGRDVTGVKVTLDGAPVPDSVTSAAVRVDPGVHVIRCAREGLGPTEDRVVLREGEGIRVLTVTLRSPAPEPPAPGPVPQPPRRTSPWVYVLGATSLVGFGVFGGFAWSGAARYDELEGSCAPRCPAGDIDGVRTRFLIADVGLVVGAVSLGAAALIFALGPPGSSRSRASLAR